MPISRPYSLGDRADHPDALAHRIVIGMAHVDAEHIDAGLEKLGDGRAILRGGTQGRDDLDAAKPSHCRIAFRAATECQTAPRLDRRLIGQPGHLARLNAGLRLGLIGELHGPVLGVLAGIDLEEAGAVIAAHQAIVAAFDAEFTVARAHESLALPFAAALVHRIDIIIFRGERAAQQDLATARLHVPPALGDPGLAIGIGDRHADAARRIVAQAEIGARRRAGDDAEKEPGGDRKAKALQKSSKDKFPRREQFVQTRRPSSALAMPVNISPEAQKRTSRRDDACRRGTGQDQDKSRTFGSALPAAEAQRAALRIPSQRILMAFYCVTSD